MVKKDKKPFPDMWLSITTGSPRDVSSMIADMVSQANDPAAFIDVLTAELAKLKRKLAMGVK